MIKYTYRQFKTANDTSKRMGVTTGRIDKVNDNDTCTLNVGGRKTDFSIATLVNQIIEDGMGAVVNPSALEHWKGWYNPKNVTKNTIINNSNKVFIVSASKEPYNDEGTSVEVAAVCTTAEKAQKAKSIVRNWLAANGYADGEVFVVPTAIDELHWYSMVSKL